MQQLLMLSWRSPQMAAAPGQGACVCAGPPSNPTPTLLVQIKAQLFKVQRRVSALEQQLGSMAALLEESRAAMGKAQEAVSRPRHRIARCCTHCGVAAPHVPRSAYTPSPAAPGHSGPPGHRAH